MHRRTLLLAALLSACATETSRDGVVFIDGDEVESLPVDAAAPPLAAGYLELGVSALDQSEDVVLRVRGANAGDQVHFFRGAAYGPGACPAQIAPTCLQLTGRATQLGSAVANNNGVATFTARMPTMRLGDTIAFQAAVPGRSPATSEVQERVVRPAGATAPYGVGATFELANLASVSPDAILAHTIEIAEPVEVAGFACRFRAGGGTFKAALYDDNNGAPGARVAGSRDARVNVGVSMAPNVAPATTLQPGRYWLSTVFSQGVETYSNGLMWNHPEWIILQPYGNALPARWPGGSFYQSPRIDCSVAVR